MSKIFKTSALWHKKLFGAVFVIVICILFCLPTESMSRDGSQLQITDDMGDIIILDMPVSRIVSLYVGHTENLIALGAGGSLIAIGHDTGDLGLSVPILGQKPGIEQIVALQPDLVLTRPMMARSQGPLYGTLKAMGIPVMALDPPTWDGFPGYVETLRKIAGGETAKKITLDNMIVPDNEIRHKLSVFLVAVGRTMATCTEDSWAAHILELAGFKNAAAGATPLAQGSVVAGFGAERLLALGEDIDAILLQHGAMNTTSALDFKRDPRFASLRAVREGMVFDVSEADISRPSMLRLERGVVESLREMVYAGGRFDE